jgi:Protein of unknown function (DUF3108)
MVTRSTLILMIFLSMVLAPRQSAAAASPDIREDLRYQVSLGTFDDVARVHLVLKELTPGHYLAEFSGAAQGMWRLLSKYLPERYQTEMVYREGRLKPLVYREEFESKGQRILKEYRFDYEGRRLTLWRQADGGAKVKKWEVPLTGPVYDLLTLFYNVRLGAFGQLHGGSNLRVMVLPTPEPQEMVFRIGAENGQSRQVMLNYRQPESGSVDHYFISLNENMVVTQAWTRVTLLGKLSGRLLNPEEIRKELLPAVALFP